jgi:hypothetical protein
VRFLLAVILALLLVPAAAGASTLRALTRST